MTDGTALSIRGGSDRASQLSFSVTTAALEVSIFVRDSRLTSRRWRTASIQIWPDALRPARSCHARGDASH